MFGFHVVRQFEQGIVFKWGRLQPDIRQAGLTWVNPVNSRLSKVNMQINVVGVPAQEAITKDNVTLTVDAVVYYSVVDPVKAVINVQNYRHAVSQVAQTSLRSVIGRSDMDELLSERERVNAELREVIDQPTEGPWGVHIERVEVKDIALPETMKRSMSRQAEAERERRARVISADGEFQASQKLSQAAGVMADTPGALQLRLLQTVVDVASEKNSTLVMPFPVELLRFFEHQAGSGPGTDPGVRRVANEAVDTDSSANPPTADTPTADTPTGDAVPVNALSAAPAAITPASEPPTQTPVRPTTAPAAHNGPR